MGTMIENKPFCQCRSGTVDGGQSPETW